MSGRGQPSSALRKVLQDAEQEMKKKGDEYISTTTSCWP